MLTNALSAKAVASLKDGKHRDGQGLQFEVKGRSRRWTFSYMFDGRQRELAIGNTLQCRWQTHGRSGLN
jgi:hypothetical protein